MSQNIYIISKNSQFTERLKAQMTISFPDFTVHECAFVAAVRGLLEHSADVIVYDSESLGTIPQGVISSERGYWLNVSKSIDDKVEMQSLVDGFSGVVHVDMPIEEVPKVIRSLLLGQIWFSRKVIAFAIRQYQSKSLTSKEMQEFLIDSLDLTHREKELARLLVKGHSNQEIADHLNISIHTVKTHVSRILTKLNVNSRNDLHAALRTDGLKNSNPKPALAC